MFLPFRGLDNRKRLIVFVACMAFFLGCRSTEIPSSGGTAAISTSVTTTMQEGDQSVTEADPSASPTTDLPIEGVSTDIPSSVVEADPSAPPSTDLSVERVNLDDDLLFLTVSMQDSPSLSNLFAGPEVYSVSTANLEYKCITCNVNAGQEEKNLLLIPPVTLSPNGDTLAVYGAIQGLDEDEYTHGGLWIIDLGSGGVRVKEHDEIFPLAWLPDGNRLLVGIDEGISIMNMNTEEIVFSADPQQFSPESENDADIPFSPSGRYFSWSSDGNYLIYDDESQYYIVRVDIGGLSATVLRPSEPVTDYDYHAFSFPTFSPAGDRILFASNVSERSLGITNEQLFSQLDYVTGGENLVHALDLYVMDANGDNQVCYTCEQDIALAWAFTPIWSPTGEQIAFWGYDFSELPDIHEKLVLLDIETDELIVLARFPTEQPFLPGTSKKSGPPRWSSDGQRLAFSAIHEDNYAIFVIDADGSNMQVIAHEAGRDFLSPLWLGDQ